MASGIQIIARRTAVGALAVLFSGSAAAQSPAPVTGTAQSAFGLFGGVDGRNDGARSSLIIGVSESYDSNVFGDSIASTASPVEQGGFYSEVTGNLTFRAGKRKLQFATNAGTDFRYYSDAGETVNINQFANAGVTYALSARTTLSSDGGVAYAPAYLYQLFNSIAPPIGGGGAIGGSGYNVTDNPSFRYDARAALSEKLSTRNQLTFRAAASYTDFDNSKSAAQGAPLRDMKTFDGEVSFIRQVSRDFNLRAGYIYRRAEYYTGVFPTEHDITVGGDYTRLLSKTRRTHLIFNVLTSSLEAVAPGDSSAILRQQYRVNGDVALSRQFGRTWQARGGYQRGTQFIQGLLTPVWTDGVNVTTSGLLSRRVDIFATAAYSVGTPIYFEQSHGFTTYTADVRTRVALNAALALSLEYLYYYYDFTQIFVPVGFPSKMSRNTGRVGLTWWIPMTRS